MDIKHIYMKKITHLKKLGLFALFVFIMLLSSGPQITIYASAFEVNTVRASSSNSFSKSSSNPLAQFGSSIKENPLVIKFGSSIQVNQGIQEIFHFFPNSKVTNFGSNIESKIKQSTGPIVYIGHASSAGILYKNKTISWESLIPMFQSAKSSFQFVLTCDANSGLKLAQHYNITLFGLPGKVDSIIGADLFSYLIGKSEQNQNLMNQSSQRILFRLNQIDLKLSPPMYLSVSYFVEHMGYTEAGSDIPNAILDVISLLAAFSSLYLSSHILKAYKAWIAGAGTTSGLTKGLLNMIQGILQGDSTTALNGLLTVINAFDGFGLFVIGLLNTEDAFVATSLFGIDISDDLASIATGVLEAAKLAVFSYTLYKSINLYNGIMQDAKDLDDIAFNSPGSSAPPAISNIAPSGGTFEGSPFIFSAIVTSTSYTLTSASIYINDNSNPLYTVNNPQSGSTISTWVYPDSYPGGSHVLTIKVTDSQGQSSEQVSTVIFPTQVVIDSPVAGSSQSSTFNFQVTLKDAAGIQNATLNIDGSSLYYWQESINQLLSDSSPVTALTIETSIDPSNYNWGTYSLSVTVFNNENHKWVYGEDVLFPSTSSGGGGGCVAKNTPILLGNGKYENVQSLKIGDILEGFNYNTQNLTTLKLTNLTVTRVNKLIDINNGFLKLTPNDQPIFIRNSTFQGWVLNPIDLRIGDMMFDPVTNSWILINSISTIQGHFKVYDVVTSSFNNYIANGVLLDIKTQ